MMKFLRSQSQTVLVVVLGVIGLGFLFYGNSGNFLSTGAQRTSSDYGRIDGEDLTVAELTDAVRTARYGLIIQGHQQDLQQPGASAQVAELGWRQLLLLREADRLHITVSDQELVKYIQSLPIFQKDGVYSPDVYEERMGQLKNVLRIQTDGGTDPTASTKAIFENVLRNQLTTNAVNSALLSGVRSSSQDVSTQYDKFYGPATVSLVTFNPQTYVASATVTPDEIAAEYKAHPTDPAYRTKEERKVDYVLLLLSPDQEKLPDAEKTAAKDALGEKATKFALAFIPDPSATPGSAPAAPDFNNEAKKESLPLATTDYFTADSTPAGVPPSPAFNSAAFALTKDNAISKVVELDNGVAVLHLAEIKPSDLRPLNEVQADIQKKLQSTKGLQQEQLTAQLIGQVIRSRVAKGEDFAKVATAMNLKVDTLPPFVPAKAPPSDPRVQAIAYAVAGLKVGDVSQPVPISSDNATLVLHLDSRAPADPAGLADFEKRYRDEQDEQLRELVSTDWANWKSKQPGTHRPPELDAYGTVD